MINYESHACEHRYIDVEDTCVDVGKEGNDDVNTCVRIQYNITIVRHIRHPHTFLG